MIFMSINGSLLNSVLKKKAALFPSSRFHFPKFPPSQSLKSNQRLLPFLSYPTMSQRGLFRATLLISLTGKMRALLLQVQMELPQRTRKMWLRVISTAMSGDTRLVLLVRRRPKHEKKKTIWWTWIRKKKNLVSLLREDPSDIWWTPMRKNLVSLPSDVWRSFRRSPFTTRTLTTPQVCVWYLVSIEQT